MSTATQSAAKATSKGYTITIIDAVIFSTTAIFIRYLTETYAMPPLVLAFWRDIIVVLVLVPIMRFFWPQLLELPSSMFTFMIWYGLVLAVYNALWTYSVALTGAALATVLTYTSGAFTALLGRWVLKEQLYLGKWLAILLSFSGIIFISGVGGSDLAQVNLIGVITGVVSGMLYAVYSLMGRTASQRGVNPWTTLLYTFGFAAIFLVGFNLVAAGGYPAGARGFASFWWLKDAWQGWVMLVILAAGPTLAGYGLYNVGLVYLPSSVANLILTMEPAFTALIAYFFLHERLTAMQILGSLLILAGVVVLRLRSKGKKPSQIPPATI